jgi:hypothetical protein
LLENATFVDNIGLSYRSAQRGAAPRAHRLARIRKKR